MSDTVIRVENLFKEYRLGTVGHGTLRHDLASWWAKTIGKEDPNSLIGKSTHKDQQELKSHFLAVNDVSFAVKQGDVLGIIGRNGAGKSTLLRCIAGLQPCTGTFTCAGNRLSPDDGHLALLPLRLLCPHSGKKLINTLYLDDHVSSRSVGVVAATTLQ